MKLVIYVDGAVQPIHPCACTHPDPQQLPQHESSLVPPARASGCPLIPFCEPGYGRG